MTANVISFSAAISACEKGGQWERQLQRSYLAMRAGREVGTAADGARKMCDPPMTVNMISLRAAISACEKGEQGEQAWVLLRMMRLVGMMSNVTCSMRPSQRA